MVDKTDLLKIPIAAIPYAGGAINEIINCVQKDKLEKRIIDIEKNIKDYIISQDMSFEDFIDISKRLDEHDYYVVRNTFKHLLLSAQPDSVEPLCRAMVDYSLKIDQDSNQIACEIMCELNSNDIKVIKKIKRIVESDEHIRKMKELVSKIRSEKETTEKKENKRREEEKTNPQKISRIPEWQYRNIVYGKHTVLWEDFGDLVVDGENNPILLKAYMALNTDVKKDKQKDVGPALEVVSIIKMEKLGIIETEYEPLSGSTTLLNYTRFHVTLLGQKLFNYICI